MTETSSNIPPPIPASWRTNSKLKIAALVVVSAFAGAAVSRATHHWHAHKMHSFMSGPVDAAEVDRRVEKMTGWVAKDVNATSEQREKLAAIAKSAAKDLLPMRETMRDARAKARELLTTASVDRAAIEQLRADQIANADAMSKRVSSALADAADILTPEQRKQLSERLAKHGPGHGWGWRRDGDKS